MLKKLPRAVLQTSRFIRWSSSEAYANAVTSLKRDLKQALIEKDIIRKNTIRGILSEVKNKEIEDKDGHMNEFTLFDVYSKVIAQRKDSIRNFLDNGRKDLADKETKEIAIIDGYKQSLTVASEEDVNAKVLDLLQHWKQETPDILMKDVFRKVDWKTISTEWRASQSLIKKSIVSQFNDVFKK
ncbi:hypothetical protein KAFR_0G01930 [Kazachstania africana CBS 2517]|uniref:Altered inheritance of mitochondria protein 41 n=1 Tax=Kazachstania africana (strain ATCC 22294 / BCRC 22015 / CBS 2517 / CECT 1963 / NBRC 1671 / NRRL Y-8276) TaxID=1071382 RepID=H2AXX7_KAZAF|nr:hypothetical protein KAFR_0G01930 [Kazachstania africana CBS 2517]CCF59227.1 hypothetical protein KAFR_0G01930 [Kazachstania africana CBS 2517]